MVNITQNSDGTFSADKNFDEIVQAYNEGKYSIVAVSEGLIIPLVMCVEGLGVAFDVISEAMYFGFGIAPNNEVLQEMIPLATANSKLPNPYPLTLTGAVSGSYDGSSAKTIEIPIGADGITPTIGDNGNWYLGDTDTNKPSRGKSAYSYAQDGGYTDTEANFYADLAAMQGLASALAAI